MLRFGTHPCADRSSITSTIYSGGLARVKTSRALPQNDDKKNVMLSGQTCMPRKTLSCLMHHVHYCDMIYANRDGQQINRTPIASKYSVKATHLDVTSLMRPAGAHHGTLPAAASFVHGRVLVAHDSSPVRSV